MHGHVLARIQAHQQVGVAQYDAGQVQAAHVRRALFILLHARLDEDAQLAVAGALFQHIDAELAHPLAAEVLVEEPLQAVDRGHRRLQRDGGGQPGGRGVGGRSGESVSIQFHVRLRLGQRRRVLQLHHVRLQPQHLGGEQVAHEELVLLQLLQRVASLQPRERLAQLVASPLAGLAGADDDVH